MNANNLTESINNQRPDITNVPAIKLKDFTPPAQIYSTQVWTQHTKNIDHNDTNDDWLQRTIAINNWMNDIEYTVNGKIVNISHQIFNGPIRVNGITGAIFNIHNSVFNSDINIGVEWARYTNEIGNGFYLREKPLTKRDQFILQIRRQQAPAIIVSKRSERSQSLFKNAAPGEIIALHLLRDMVGGDTFKKYLKYGFVTIKGNSGAEYQITRSSHIIKVRKNNKHTHSLCIYIKDQSIPPTDEVVAKILMCELDEEGLWDKANVNVVSSEMNNLCVA